MSPPGKKTLLGWLRNLPHRAEAFLLPWLAELPPERQRRARLVNWCLLVMAAMMFLWLVVNLSFAAWTLFAWLSGLFLATVLILYLLHKGFLTEALTHATCLIMVATIVVSSVFSGGLTAAMLTLFAVVPVGAVTAAGRKGLPWLVPAILAVLVLHHLENSGHVFIFLTPPEKRPLDAALTWLTSALIVTLLIFYYEVARQRTENEIIKDLLQMQEASQVKTRFISHFSHEVRTPLHGILGMLALMEDESDAEARRRLGSEARRAGKALLATISDVLEISRPQQSLPANRPSSEPGQDKTAAGKAARRVLVIEDDPVGRLLVTTLITRMGFAVVEASSGQVALELLERESFDLVIMDCQLPDMDGEKVARLWRGREQVRGGRWVPIVAVSAQATHEQHVACLMAGMDDFLPKPFGKDELAAVVRRWSECNVSGNGAS